MASHEYFQDKLVGNHCFGCGADNPHGLQIKSYWEGENLSVCQFNPLYYHTAAPSHFLNGGIIAMIIDCHCICTAIAYAYQFQEREIGEGNPIWFATSNLTLNYKRPVNIAEQVILEASVMDYDEKRASLACKLTSEGKTCVEATLEAIAVTEEWMNKSPDKNRI
ncbi:hypothetical protein [Photobacterium marinum]|nr:hypothetical protein [Photobacterium marinum]